MVVDGDKSLVVADETIISVAERNIKKYDIVPLYYNMRKANPIKLTNQTIYEGLTVAFTGGNIGIYSNNISKIWNSEVFISGSASEKEDAINIIKILCMESNFVIDHAKTLYKPQRPKFIDEKIKNTINESLPHFFIYAKEKEKFQVCKINDSLVNKLNNIIPNPRINCRKLKLGEIDYKLLMHSPDIECKVEFTKNGRLIKEKSNPIIVKYCELNSLHHFQINNIIYINETFSYQNLMKSQIKQELRCLRISLDIKKELSQFGYSEQEITDILVKYLYGIKKSKFKMNLWLCYGDYIYENLQKHFKLQNKTIQCIDCGEWFEVSVNNKKTCRCMSCKREYRNEYQKKLMRKIKFSKLKKRLN